MLASSLYVLVLASLESWSKGYIRNMRGQGAYEGAYQEVNKGHMERYGGHSHQEQQEPTLMD